MYLILTRSFPPEVGGMQNLMWGLANSLSKYFMIKVFADYYDQHESYDKEVSFSVERIGGIKFLRKFRKSHLVNEFIKNNKNIEGIIADHWKSLELHYRGRIRELRDLKPIRNDESDLSKAMKLIAQTGKGPENQIPSMGCNIKWSK